ncbi:pyridoxal kinase, partial [Salmonella enterica subsp. enterica serovar Typhimurium]
ELILPPAGEAR